MRVEASTVDAIFGAANFAELVAEYDAESRIAGLPGPTIKLATYQAIERSGMLHPIAAWDGPRLIGFVAVLQSLVPHFERPVTCTESFFVAADARGSGAGLALLAAAEAKARELGANGLLISAPFGGALARVLPRCGYRDVSRVFFKQFFDA